ncbi:phosphatase PAP2 family protein [Calditrichota bacterium]
MLDFLQQIDVALMYFLNVTVRNPVFSWIMPIFDDDTVFLVPLGLIWLALMIWGGAKGRWAGIGAIVIVTLTDQISSFAVKPFFERIRPCNVLPGIYMWKDAAWIQIPDVITQVYKGSFSFTSSHATNTAGQAFWWSFMYPKYKWGWIALAAAIGYSRIYDGVHYPFDVLGGWILGALCFAVVYYPAAKWGPKSLRKSQLRPVKDQDEPVT